VLLEGYRQFHFVEKIMRGNFPYALDGGHMGFDRLIIREKLIGGREKAGEILETRAAIRD
jgi:hypothetical protein